jgi:hypothetical protein
MFIEDQHNIEWSLKLTRCPHCFSNIDITCRSMLGDRMLFKQFYSYYNYHLNKECIDNRTSKRVRIMVKFSKNNIHSFEDVNIIV